MLRQKVEKYKFQVLFLMVLVCYFMYSLVRVYGFSLLPDEFGYWSYAAKAAGCDWSDIVSLGSYYSYGYSLILIPIFMVFEDAVIAYRVAVAVNFLLLFLAFVVLERLLNKLFLDLSDANRAIYTAVAVFYPSWLFYSKMTMTEVVLMSLFVFLCALLYYYVENNRLFTLCGFVLMLVYIYFVHMRSVAVLIAGGMSVGMYLLMKVRKLKPFLIIIGIGCGLLAVGIGIKELVSGMLYAGSDASTMGINDYSGQFEKIKYIFTKDGIKDFAISLIGKILYMGTATYGLAYWGIGYGTKEIWRILRDKTSQKETAKAVLYLFVILSVIGQLLISSIYNIVPIRITSITYGRYHEFVFPILMIMGLVAIAEAKHVWKITLGVIAVQIPMVLIVLYGVELKGLISFAAYFMVGMSYVHSLEWFDVEKFYWLALAFGALLTLLCTGLVRLSKRHESTTVVQILFVALELVLVIITCGKYSDIYNSRAREDTYIVRLLEEMESDERRIVYINSGNATTIDYIQFMMRDSEIVLLENKGAVDSYTAEELQADDLILADASCGFLDALEERYGRNCYMGHFALYYNE